jgi:hypothetical protein
MKASVAMSQWNSMSSMGRLLSMLVVVLGGGSLGALGLYLGFKLSRFRPHRKSAEIQTVFTRSDLDQELK